MLGAGTTWMSEATPAVTLLWRYGKGGFSLRQHIVNMCSDQTAKIRICALLLRLREEQEQEQE